MCGPAAPERLELSDRPVDSAAGGSLPPAWDPDGTPHGPSPGAAWKPRSIADGPERMPGDRTAASFPGSVRAIALRWPRG